MKKKWPPLREIDGVRWIALNIAAQFVSRKSEWIMSQVEAGILPSTEIDGKIHVQYAALNRHMREVNVPKPPTVFGVGLSGNSNPGPLSAHREKQMPLPMPIGRKGRGWVG